MTRSTDHSQNRQRSPSYSNQHHDHVYSDNAFGDDMDGFAIDTTDVPSFYSRTQFLI